MSAKTYTVITHRRGRETEVTRTLPELVEYFRYTLESGHSYNPKINKNPKTFKGLITALNKAVDELQGGNFYPTTYEAGNGSSD